VLSDPPLAIPPRNFSHRNLAIDSKALPMEFDTFDLMQSLRYQIALAGPKPKQAPNVLDVWLQ